MTNRTTAVKVASVPMNSASAFNPVQVLSANYFVVNGVVYNATSNAENSASIIIQPTIAAATSYQQIGDVIYAENTGVVYNLSGEILYVANYNRVYSKFYVLGARRGVYITVYEMPADSRDFTYSEGAYKIKEVVETVDFRSGNRSRLNLGSYARVEFAGSVASAPDVVKARFVSNAQSYSMFVAQEVRGKLLTDNVASIIVNDAGRIQATLENVDNVQRLSTEYHLITDAFRGEVEVWIPATYGSNPDYPDHSNEPLIQTSPGYYTYVGVNRTILQDSRGRNVRVFYGATIWDPNARLIWNNGRYFTITGNYVDLTGFDQAESSISFFAGVALVSRTRTNTDGVTRTEWLNITAENITLAGVVTTAANHTTVNVVNADFFQHASNRIIEVRGREADGSINQSRSIRNRAGVELFSYTNQTTAHATTGAVTTTTLSGWNTTASNANAIYVIRTETTAGSNVGTDNVTRISIMRLMPA
jgi:hypothetical protein